MLSVFLHCPGPENFAQLRSCSCGAPLLLLFTIKVAGIVNSLRDDKKRKKTKGDWEGNGDSSSDWLGPVVISQFPVPCGLVHGSITN